MEHGFRNSSNPCLYFYLSTANLTNMTKRLSGYAITPRHLQATLSVRLAILPSMDRLDPTHGWELRHTCP